MKCSFCGSQMKQGTGKLVAQVDGKLQYFCSRKCEVHVSKLRHQPRDIAWTATNRKQRGKVKQ